MMSWPTPGGRERARCAVHSPQADERRAPALGPAARPAPPGDRLGVSPARSRGTARARGSDARGHVDQSVRCVPGLSRPMGAGASVSAGTPSRSKRRAAYAFGQRVAVTGPWAARAPAAMRDRHQRELLGSRSSWSSRTSPATASCRAGRSNPACRSETCARPDCSTSGMRAADRLGLRRCPTSGGRARPWRHRLRSASGPAEPGGLPGRRGRSGHRCQRSRALGRGRARASDRAPGDPGRG